VFGVEPDVRMADVARAQGLEVDVARFEDWDPEGRRFDVVVSAQAWHWIDPVLGAECARTVLHDGGVLAVLWNVPEHEPAVHEAFDVVYDRYRLPDGSRCSPPAALAEGTDRFAAGIAAAGGFAPPRHEIGTWIQSYTSAEWVDLLPTHSDHCLMEPAVLDDLLAATAEVIESFGGRIDVTYTTHRLTATTVG
jgi:SAM-dependent methyltransferase